MTVCNDLFRAPLEWKFSPVFGERIAGEDIQDGELSTQMSVSPCCSAACKRSNLLIALFFIRRSPDGMRANVNCSLQSHLAGLSLSSIALHAVRYASPIAESKRPAARIAACLKDRLSSLSFTTSSISSLRECQDQ
ncbi:hypothetical protein SDJN02_14147, partial [Cucurbita argyrosperma subsp. argyrosperma]